ncbi:hypothetical protein HaLaN_09206, partial [Haematococcus lacustris]
MDTYYNPVPHFGFSMCKADEALWGGLGLLNGDGAEEEEEAQQQVPSGSLPSQPGTAVPAATPGMPPPASQPEAGADEDERFTLSGSSLTIKTIK